MHQKEMTRMHPSIGKVRAVTIWSRAGIWLALVGTLIALPCAHVQFQAMVLPAGPRSRCMVFDPVLLCALAVGVLLLLMGACDLIYGRRHGLPDGLARVTDGMESSESPHAPTHA
jgi:uncharacterized membrane protein